ncbi:MAG: HEAT repeat domain-containing protein [Lentisphaerae bacterium]|nr:HEAT repeat domain-containing protein [Lentisphaerota bacterium]
MLAQQLPSDWILAWEEIERQAGSEVPEDAVSLRETAADPETHPWLRGRALVALAKHDRDGSHAAANAATASSNAVTRAAACEALGFSGNAETAPLLVEMLKDTDETVRHEAAVSLARVQGSNAWSNVEALVAASPAPFARQQALVLAHIDTDVAREALRSRLTGTNAMVRAETARALHAAPKPSLVPLLLDMIASGRDKTVRSAAEGTLRSWDAEFLGPPLAGVLRSDEPKRVLPAIRLLFLRPSYAGGDALAELVQQGSETMSRAVLTESMDTLLAISPERYRDTFRNYLEDKDATLRVRAITALAAGRPDEELFELLRDPLADTHDSVFRLALRMVQRRTTSVPEDGFVSFLSPHFATAETPRIRGFLDLMRHRLPEEELPAALELLTPLLHGADSALRDAAANVFKESADDKVALQAVAAQGYVARWLVLGPFDNDRYNRGFATEFGPETALDMDAAYDGTTRPVQFLNEEPGAFTDLSTNDTIRIKWQPMSIVSSDASLRLNRLVLGPQEYFVAYATAEIMAPEEQVVDIRIVADDTFKFWLNEEELLSVTDEPVTKAMMKDRKAWEALMTKWHDNRHEETVRTTLKKGRNRLLMKVCNFTYQWYFRMRISETNGARANFEEMVLGE